MNYVQAGHFSAKKAGGIGLTVAVHALVACGVIFGLNHTFTRTAVPESTFVPPKTVQPKVDPIVDKFKLPPVSTSAIRPFLPPDFFDNTAITPPSPTTGTVDKGIPSDEPVKSGGDGEAHKLVGESASAIANLEGCKPDYPRSSLLAQESGVVRVLFKIGADSRLISARVLKSSGFTALDKAAVNGLSQCHFTSAMQDGVPVSSSLTTDYVWTLGE
ncbi:MAG TPA: TonB family protein [Burkholderiaceae bacterium]|jgi:protein TonB|nr:TonB family protein [Burkholderiaceae bacterium]